MSDIEIIVRRDMAHVHGRTEAGINWIQDSVINEGSATVIPLDVVEDFVIEIKKEGLTVEVK